LIQFVITQLLGLNPLAVLATVTRMLFLISVGKNHIIWHSPFVCQTSSAVTLALRAGTYMLLACV